MNSGKRLPLALCLLVVALGVQAYDPHLILAAGGRREAAPPERFGDTLLLSYSFGGAPDKVRIHTVGAAFHHEGFQEIHWFERNEYGVFVLLFDPPGGLTEIRYRLIVDGIWTVDPSNPLKVVDRWGVALSRVDFPKADRAVLRTPVVHPDGTVDFLLDAHPGSSVAVVGSFNGWDPYLTPLAETSPGTFSLRLRLGPGEHLYYFSVDGLRVADPRNPEQRMGYTGTVVSAVRVEPPAR